MPVDGGIFTVPIASFTILSLAAAVTIPCLWSRKPPFSPPPPYSPPPPLSPPPLLSPPRPIDRSESGFLLYAPSSDDWDDWNSSFEKVLGYSDIPHSQPNAMELDSSDEKNFGDSASINDSVSSKPSTSFWLSTPSASTASSDPSGASMPPASAASSDSYGASTSSEASTPSELSNDSITPSRSTCFSPEFSQVQGRQVLNLHDINLQLTTMVERPPRNILQ
ncbi:hypothetical protein BKA57DRAFT_477334 [Linnemannia elongata]|nr:hypothetical protein BKA57DRAFT_477334 [Linnemannia elongata]